MFSEYLLRVSPVSVSQRVFVIERAVIRIVLDFMIGPLDGLSPSVTLSLCHPPVSLSRCLK